MLKLPERIWIARREYERYDGIELVERIITHGDLCPEAIEYGYEITEYVHAEKTTDEIVRLRDEIRDLKSELRTMGVLI